MSSSAEPVLRVNQTIREEIANDVPYNKLYDYVFPYGERYNVIGCRMCHIPVRDGFDPRLGKFPWEQSKKECGLHDHGSGI